MNVIQATPIHWPYFVLHATTAVAISNVIPACAAVAITLRHNVSHDAPLTINVYSQSCAHLSYCAPFCGYVATTVGSARFVPSCCASSAAIALHSVLVECQQLATWPSAECMRHAFTQSKNVSTYTMAQWHCRLRHLAPLLTASALVHMAAHVRIAASAALRC